MLDQEQQSNKRQRNAQQSLPGLNWEAMPEQGSTYPSEEEELQPLPHKALPAFESEGRLPEPFQPSRELLAWLDNPKPDPGESPLKALYQMSEKEFNEVEKELYSDLAVQNLTVDFEPRMGDPLDLQQVILWEDETQTKGKMYFLPIWWPRVIGQYDLTEEQRLAWFHEALRKESTRVSNHTGNEPSQMLYGLMALLYLRLDLEQNSLITPDQL